MVAPISAYSAVNNYTQIISDYRNIQQQVVNEKPVEKSKIYAMGTLRRPEDITERVISSKISFKAEKPKKIDTTQTDKKIEKYDKDISLLRNAPILERLDYVIEKLKRGEFVSSVAMGALAIMYGPEDLREVSSALKQIKSAFGTDNYVPDYDYKTAQHPFSFFRGSILHKTMNPFAPNSRFSWLKTWLLEKDKTLLDTNLGKNFLDYFDIQVENVDTTINEIMQRNPSNPKKVQAKKYIANSKLGELTARAMTRIPILGVVADAGIKAIEFGYDLNSGENFFEAAAKNTAELAVSTVTTAALGAIGSKLGPIGSLGALTVANYINQKFSEAIG